VTEALGQEETLPPTRCMALSLQPPAGYGALSSPLITPRKRWSDVFALPFHDHVTACVDGADNAGNTQARLLE
jgi:hypothetical protein